jgi:hypothetical protein
MDPLGEATVAAAATKHEHLGPGGLLDECSAHVVVVANELDVELDLGELVAFGLQRPEETVALTGLHAVHPRHEPRIPPHGRRPNPHRCQPHLPTCCSLEGEPDRLCRRLRAIHTDDDAWGRGPGTLADRRPDHDDRASSIGRQGDAHRPLRKAAEGVGTAAAHHEEFGVVSSTEERRRGSSQHQLTGDADAPTP